MNNKKGVTLIELVLVIIIILIIATFSVFSGREAIDQATATEIYTEINGMRTLVNNIIIKKDLDETFSLEKGTHYDVKASEINASEEEFEGEYNIEIESGDFDNLYIIYGMDESEKYNTSNVKGTYGLESLKHTYLVNFEKGKVDLLKSVNIADKNVRTFEQIRALIEQGKI